VSTIPAPSVADAVTSLAREGSGRILAILARRYRDLDLADEAVQDALVQAVETWPRSGIPDEPAAWLFTVANRKALDALRRSASERRRLLASAPPSIPSWWSTAQGSTKQRSATSTYVSC